MKEIRRKGKGNMRGNEGSMKQITKDILNNPPAVIGVGGRGSAGALPPSFALPASLPAEQRTGRPGGTRRPGWPARAGRARPTRSAGRPSRPGSTGSAPDQKIVPSSFFGESGMPFWSPKWSQTRSASSAGRPSGLAEPGRPGLASPAARSRLPAGGLLCRGTREAQRREAARRRTPPPHSYHRRWVI